MLYRVTKILLSLVPEGSEAGFFGSKLTHVLVLLSFLLLLHLPQAIVDSLAKFNGHSVSPLYPFGGRFSIEKDKWDTVQSRVDCICSKGHWMREENLQALMNMSADCGKSCGTGPWTRASDPAFFYSWSGHGEACGKPAQPFSRDLFCRALGGRELLIVGDSTSFTFHTTLLGALDFLSCEPREDPTGFYEVPHSQWDGCSGHLICDGEASLRYVRNDYLTLRPPFTPEEQAEWDATSRLPWDRTHYLPWLHLVTNNTLLVLNRGAHWIATPQTILELGKTLSGVRERAPGAGVVFRNTPRGHDLSSVRNPAEDGKLILPLARHQNLSRIPSEYHYDDFPLQNGLEAELVANFSGSGIPVVSRPQTAVLFLDVATSTELRADHHFDPLHYCVPGPVDNWAFLLQTALLAPIEIK